MRTLCGLVLALPLAVAAQDATSFPEPYRVGTTSLCTERGSVEVCLTRDDDGARFVVSADGTEAGRWRAAGPSVADDLRAFAVDLGGDGGDETIVAHQEAVSNGLGIATWTVYVLGDASEPAYSFVARDFGAGGGSFAVWRGRPVVWATEWLDSEDPSGRRGTGYYLVGRPFVLTPSGLEPVADLPVRARRLMESFDRGTGGPVAWLSDRRAESRRIDPFSPVQPGGEAGTVEAAEDARDGYRMTLRLGAAARTVRVDPWGSTVPEAEVAVRLGDGASGRLFPIAYRPPNLVGRHVRLGAETGGRRVLWLD